MPTVTFKVDTPAAISRFEVQGSGGLEPIDHDNGTGTRTFDSGYRGTCTLVLHGQQNQRAKLKITQSADGQERTLAERNHIKITSPTGRASATVGFVVQ